MPLTLALLLFASTAQPPETVERGPEPMPAPALAAGAAAAGFVGGALLAVPTLFSLLPAGPFIAAPIAIAILGVGAGFGGFLGGLLHARLLPSLGVAGISAGLAIAGAGVGAATGALAFGVDPTTGFLAALLAGAFGGLAGAAGGGALGAWIVSPAPTETDLDPVEPPTAAAP